MPVFRVLSGTHCEGERGPDGKLVKYRRGDVFRARGDLDKTHNHPGSIRYERLPENTPTKNANVVAQAAAEGFNTAFTDSDQSPPGVQSIFADLQKMDVAALTKFAQEEEIDLGNLKKKEEIIAQIKKSMTPATAKA